MDILTKALFVTGLTLLTGGTAMGIVGQYKKQNEDDEDEEDNDEEET